VRHHERAAFEMRTGIRIKEQDSVGQLAPAMERDEYFPIALATPFELNEAALGFDLGSNRVRWEALEMARDRAQAVVMESVRLVEAPANPSVLMAVAPVYHQPSKTLEERRDNLRGFVLGMYRIDRLVDYAIAQLPPQGLAFLLEDLDAPPENRLLHFHDSRIETFDWEAMRDAPFRYEELIAETGRRWRMVVFPTDAFVQTHLFRGYWWILPSGLLFTLLMALLLRTQLSGRLQAELLVQERTADLQESEEHLLSVFRVAPVGIGVVIDRVLQEVNAQMCEITGYAKEELTGQPARMLYVNDEDHEYVGREKYGQIRDSGTGTVETRWKCKDGHIIDVLLSSTPLDLDDLSKGVTFTTLNITDRKRAEELLRSAKQQLQHIIDNTCDVIFQIDLEGNYIYTNSAAETLTGYSVEQLLQMNMMELIAPEYQRGVATLLQQRIRGKVGTGRVTLEIICKEGARKWMELVTNSVFDDDGALVAVQGLARDITERKMMEREMQDNEARFRGMFEHMSSGVAIYEAVGDGGDFVFVDFNPAGERIEKVARQDVIGKRLTEVFPASKEMGILEVLQRVWRTGLAEDFPVSFYKDDRIEGWRDNYVYRLPTGEIVAVYDDLTAQRQAELAMKESEERFRAFFENSADAMLIIKDGQFINCNNAAVSMLGYEQKEGIINQFPSMLSPKFQPDGQLSDEKAVEMLREAESVGHSLFEWDHTRKDGTVIPVEVSLTAIDNGGKPLLHVVWRDMTARKKAEMDRERLMTAIDQVAETIVITGVDGTILYVNPAFEKITGYSREEAMGQNPRVLKSGQHETAFYKDMWETLESGETWVGRIVNRRKDEALYTEEATISPVRDHAGQIINYVAIKSDITAELAREERYRQVQKMETVGRLAGGVAHDFNNILQTITGFCELILVEMDGQSTQRQDVLEIQKAAHLAGKLTQQLLTFSREKSTQYAEIDINTVLSGGRKMLERSLDERFQLELDLGSQKRPVVADASQILQIALNLVVNARDAMPNGGTITICTQSIEVDQNHLPKGMNAQVGEWVCFSVSDTGCGMDKAQLKHLFEPFYTTKKLGEGTGLGLSVVYGIVEEHGGWIDVDSEPGEGTVFRICLPLGDSEVSGGGLSEDDEAEGKHILLVEDDVVVKELTSEILQDVGYSVLSVESAQEARDVFALKNGAFDMLFVDVMLPDENGIELVDTLLGQKNNIPTLMSSGLADEQLNMDVIKKKGLSFIRKPYNLSKLLRAVNSLLAD